MQKSIRTLTAAIILSASAIISTNANAGDLVITGTVTGGAIEQVDEGDCKTLAVQLADAIDKLRACHKRCTEQVIRPPEGPGSITPSSAVAISDLVLAGDDVRRPPARTTPPRTPKSPGNLCNALPNKTNDRGHQIGGCQTEYRAYGVARARLAICTGEGTEEPVW